MDTIENMSRRSRQKKYGEQARRREQKTRPETVLTVPAHGAAPGGSAEIDTSGGWDAHPPGWVQKQQARLKSLPCRVPLRDGSRLVNVYVEGYEDVSFWRGIFDDYECDTLTFEIGVPPRPDLAKGKKVIMGMIPESSPDNILCVDSDFDYLFGDDTDQSLKINNSDFVFHTYAYSTENYLCYSPSLHNVCVRATKNDTRIFDFEYFMARYSEIIYPLFIWYAFSAHLKDENIFTLLEFKSSVKLNYLEVENNGDGTLKWLERQVDKRLNNLHAKYPEMESGFKPFQKQLKAKGVTPPQTYMFMQGHTLMDNVVMIMLNAVCEQLKIISNARISASTKTGTALKNELSNYNNSIRNVREILLDNESYKSSPLYRKLKKDMDRYVAGLKHPKD